MGVKGFSSVLVTSRKHLQQVLTNSVRSAGRITYSYSIMEHEENVKKITNLKQNMFSIYRSAVSAVMPRKLVADVIRQCDDHNYLINGKKYFLNKNVFVVGFGKAVLGMAVEVNHMLSTHIVRGILSVPVGTGQFREVEEIRKQNIEVREGAAGNLPDENAESTAQDIADLVHSLQGDTVLLVLISGGGSALLPAPMPGFTVRDKAHLVNQLQSRGASIQEVNSVRKKLSLLKGGKLASKAFPAHVITFILSDVIGDPLDLIASGPTVQNPDPPCLALKIVQKYGLEKELPGSVLQVLVNSNCEDHTRNPHADVFNILIGSNKTALQAAQDAAVKANYLTFILSDKINASVTELSEWYSSLCVLFCNAQKSNNYEELKTFLQAAITKYNFSSDIVKTLLSFAAKFNDDHVKGLCVIGGGEPTVTIKEGSNNKGGRSQELALRFSVKMHELSQKNSFDVICVLMAAGTDGIDGPTDVAGAFGYLEQIYVANKQGINAQTYIGESNSYGYFSLLPDDFIKIGHTGTNVMDLHVLVIQKGNEILP